MSRFAIIATILGLLIGASGLATGVKFSFDEQARDQRNTCNEAHRDSVLTAMEVDWLDQDQQWNESILSKLDTVISLCKGD